MQLTLILPDDQKAELERRAAAAGLDPSRFVQLVVQEQLIDSDESGRGRLSREEWKRRFRCWISGQPSRSPSFDDSRESIYP